MTYDSALFDPTQLCLEINPDRQTQLWQRSRQYGTASSQWNAYLNELVLATLLPCLQEEYAPSLKPSPSVANLPGIWELVNGTAIAMPGLRLVLIPTEAIDTEELRVPQEWVDLPDWAADYYVAVQVNPDEAWVRVNGYVSYRQLKEKAQYDWRDRTYCLSELDWIADLSRSELGVICRVS